MARPKKSSVAKPAEPKRDEGLAKAPPLGNSNTIISAPTTAIYHTPETHGAHAVPHYRDRHEEYLLVTRDDLREIRNFGWFQQTLFGVGTFFFSGAFWLLAELIAHQEHGKFEFTPWMAVCVISMIAGAALGFIGFVMFLMRQRRLNKYFANESERFD
jgi:hypothetical protein